MTDDGDGGVPYAGLDLDRAENRRRDAAWVAAAAAGPDARIHALWRDQCLVAGDPPLPVMLRASAGAGDDTEPSGLVLLGVGDRGPRFAADLSGLALEEALSRAGAEAAVDTRTLFTHVSAADAAALAHARGVLHWHRHQLHCGRCGAATEPRDAGHHRICTNPACGGLLFPRIEPAVITLVETTAVPRRCLLARHRASPSGSYSLLAGFVEIGESLEDAVRREIREETGVEVSAVTYLASQPWPFPAGLMIGFRATASEATISVDGEEIVEARWFTADALRELQSARGGLGRPDSIDRIMLTAWLDEHPDRH